MARQNDLRLEAKHLMKFRQNFADRENIIFPEPIPGYVHENALVEVSSSPLPSLPHLSYIPRPIMKENQLLLLWEKMLIKKSKIILWIYARLPWLKWFSNTTLSMVTFILVDTHTITYDSSHLLIRKYFSSKTSNKRILFNLFRLWNCYKSILLPFPPPPLLPSLHWLC